MVTLYAPAGTGDGAYRSIVSVPPVRAKRSGRDSTAPVTLAPLYVSPTMVVPGATELARLLTTGRPMSAVVKMLLAAGMTVAPAAALPMTIAVRLVSGPPTVTVTVV